MTSVNPKILRWARETAGLTLDEASRKLRFADTKAMLASEKLERLESGEISPTKKNLEDMAKVYRRPLVVFYLNEIPKESRKLSDFRKKDAHITPVENGYLNALIRDVIVRQDILKNAYLEEDDPMSSISFVGTMDLSSEIKPSAGYVVKNIGFNIVTFRERKGKEDAFNYLRNCVEDAGIFVLLANNLGNYHTNLATDVFRGFTLYDDFVPFIVINSNDSKAALSFSLLHEVVHIFLGQSSISNGNLDHNVEVFCDTVASEILLADNDLAFFDHTDFGNKQETIDHICALSDRYKISASMIALRLFKKKLIDKQSYSELSEYFYAMWLEAKQAQKDLRENKKSGGPSYYLVKSSQVGKNLINLVRFYTSNGTFSINTAGKVLGVSANNVIPLLESRP